MSLFHLGSGIAEVNQVIEKGSVLVCGQDVKMECYLGSDYRIATTTHLFQVHKYEYLLRQSAQALDSHFCSHISMFSSYLCVWRILFYLRFYSTYMCIIWSLY